MNTTDLATPKQIAFINKLVSERELIQGDEYLVSQVLDPNNLDMHTKKVASGCIEMLLTRAEKTGTKYTRENGNAEDNYGIPNADALPTGRYAIDNADGELTFYHVWRGTKNPDYVKLYLLHGPDETEIPFSKGMVTVLKTIAQDAASAAIRYGHEIGACSVCAKRLTNRVSRALGIGPICGGHFYGEEWKSTVHGAREQIKAQGLDPDGNVEEGEEVERYDVRADYEAPDMGSDPALSEPEVDVNRYAAISRVGHPAPSSDATWAQAKHMADTMSDAELDSVIALLTREQEKREFAKREQEQERAAYEAEMRYEQSFLGR